MFQAGSYMLTSVLPTRSFHQLFLIRLLLMVVMAAFLAHWKVVLQNFSTNHLCAHSCGALKACFYQTLLFTKKTDDRLIWGQRGYELSLKV